MNHVLARANVIHTPAPVAAQPITADRYISTDWLAREADRIWPRAWLFAGLERDLAEPGDYRVFNIAYESILITRTEPGELAAFFNVCQHRGARVVVNDHGWVKNFVCPYHGWTYGYDGHLDHVPDPERFTGGIDCEKRSLRPIRVGAVGGLVWICMDEAAPSLTDFLGEAWQAVAAYHLEDMTLYEDQTVELDCNWKAVFDNFGELYHVDHIHPQHELLFDCPTAENHLFDYGHTGVVIDGHTVNTRMPIPEKPNPYLKGQLRMFGGDPDAYDGRVLEIRTDIPRLRREAGPRLGWCYDDMSDLRLSDIEQYNFFPNTMITVQPDDAIVMRTRPHPTDPNKCFWDKLTFRRQPRAEVADRANVAFEPHDPADVADVPRPEHDQFTQDEIIAGNKSMTITIDQDIHLIRDIQAGMRSRGFRDAKLCDDEIRVQHYHDWLNHWMGDRSE
ncbi:MAG TPA: aromatic ring-hydroxylating dioxygenase subunit alpha [Myxococcales bacterium]|nr:aromatic ring-hydroxylating dioxygenase subunit alpha [Myxococcales bacterium]HIK85501.1 aromatic ring-hydroxylating dioxygenase subunit alpha [Myxococcales bacterium]